MRGRLKTGSKLKMQRERELCEANNATYKDE